MILKRASLGMLAVCTAWMTLGAARATIDDALTMALEAAQPAVKEGFTVREDYWGGDMPAKQPKPIAHQLFKGNEYWFWMGTDTKGAKISVHVYDNQGKLVEDEARQSGQTAVAHVKPKRTGTYYLLVEVEKSPEERTTWSLAYGFR